MARKLEVEIVGDASKFQKSVRDADRAATGLGHSLKGMGKVAAITGIGALGAGLAVGLKSVVSAAQEAEVSQRRMEQALKNVGVSYQAHAAQIDQVIQKTSNLAALDDEDLQDAFSKLVRTTGDVNQALKDTALAADVARGMNISLEAATRLVQKAELGKAGALAKAGIEVDKNATKQELLAKLQEKFAGSAESYGKSAAGAQERLGVAFENLQETIGQKVLPILADLLEGLVRVIAWVEVNWPKFQKAFNDAAAVVKQAFEKIKPILDGLVTFLRGVVKIIDGIVHGEWGKVWDGLKQVVSGAFAALYALVKLQLSLIRDAMLAVGRRALAGLEDGLTGIAGIVSDKLHNAIDMIRDLVGNVYAAAKNFGANILKGIGDGLAALGGKLVDWILAPVRAVIGQINGVIRHINSALEFDVGGVKVHGHTVVPSIHVDAPDIPEIPGLASGGIVTRPTLALVGEAGPEAVVPLSRYPAGQSVQHHHHYHGPVVQDRDFINYLKRLGAQDKRRGGPAFGGA